MAVQRLLSLASVFLCAATAQPLGKSAISGTVVDGESNDPIRKAVVTLTLEGRPSRWATTRTDAVGRFEFTGLPAGKYHLRALKANEGTAIYGANSLRELGDLIMLGDAETHPAVKLRFLHAASLSGHVYDSDGEPVPNANVNLLRQGRNLGAPVLVNAGNANTDDRGEYRVTNVDPGRYYLRVTPQTWGWPGKLPGGHTAMLASQFYGGARESKDAAPVHVSGGDSLAGLDFHLISEPAVELHGQIAGVPHPPEPPPAQQAGSNDNLFEGAPGPQITISPADSGTQNWSSTTMAQGPDHRFQLPDIPAGHYRLDASFESGGKTYAASKTMDLQPGVGDIVLTLAPAVDIQGTFRVDGPASRARSGASFRVQFTRSGGRRTIAAQIGTDGRFTLKDVPPGEWQLAVTPIPPGYLKAAQLGDKDVRFTTCEVGSQSEPLNIVVSLRTAAVTGEVDGETSPSKRAGIVIAPLGPYHNVVRYYHSVIADEDGKFEVSGIAPGKYKIFAIEKMTPAAFRNPEAADQLEELGDVLELAEGATVQAHPKLIPAARAQKVLP
jgi:uncharacterized surface anchored protein